MSGGAWIVVVVNALCAAWNIWAGNYGFGVFSALLVLALCASEIVFAIRNNGRR